MSQPFIYSIIGFALGALALWLFFRSKLASSTFDSEKSKELQKLFDESNTQLKRLGWMLQPDYRLLMQNILNLLGSTKHL